MCKRARLGTVAAAAAVLLFGAGGCDDNVLPEAAPRTASGPEPTEKEPRHEEFVGVVVSANTVVLTSPIDGKLLEVPVATGARVASGDPVARFDSALLSEQRIAAEAHLRAAAAERQRARVALGEAKQRYSRREKVAGEIVSEEEVEAARYAVRDAAAALEQLSAEVDRRASELQVLIQLLESAELKSPINGTVSVRFAEAEMVVQKGAPIVRIVGDGELGLRFAVPEKDSGALRVGQNVVVKLGDDGEKKVSARITRVAPELDPISQMIVVEAEFQRRVETDLLLAGTAASVVIEPGPPATSAVIDAEPTPSP